MIIISSSLVLTADQFGPNSPVIGWHNLVTPANLAATSEDANFPVTNLANPATYLKWKAASVSASARFVTITHNTVDPIDYVGVARHNFGSGKVTVSLEGYNTAPGGTPSWFTLVSDFLPADDAPIIMRFTLQSLIGVRIKMVPVTTVRQEIGVVYVGALLSMQRNLYVGHAPITMARRINATNGRSESGEFTGRIILGRKNASSASFNHLTPGWVRSRLKPFLLAAEEKPFFFAWRPTTYPNEVGYVWMTNDPEPVNEMGNGMMGVDLQFTGVV